MSGPEHYQEAERILAEIKATPSLGASSAGGSPLPGQWSAAVLWVMILPLRRSLAVPRWPSGRPCAERLDTTVTTESARRSIFAVRADGSLHSAATVRQWTSSRTSGSVMASGSQVRSRADRNPRAERPSSRRSARRPSWR